MVPAPPGGYPRAPMPDVLIASDEDWVRAEVASVLSTLPGLTAREVSAGTQVLPAVRQSMPALVVVDLQMGSMGGMAVCMELRLEESGGRIDHVPVLMLLDRRPDVFLARRAGAEGWVVKPFDPMRLRRAITALLEGQTYEDPSYLPDPVG